MFDHEPGDCQRRHVGDHARSLHRKWGQAVKKITTVAIVDDEPELREHITGYLSAVGKVRCHGSYSSAAEALQHLPHEKPDVVLMDINLGGMDGIECVRRLKP